MSVNSMAGITNDYLTQAVKNDGIQVKSNKKTNESGTFDELYQAALNLITGTNSYIQQAQQAEIDYAMGKLTSTHELSIIEAKANTALQYTVAIKNGIIDAYKEIMQIQI